MSLPKISVSDAKVLIAQGALLVDIRGPDEFAREFIGGAKNIPLQKIATTLIGQGHSSVIFQCKTGMRTVANAAALAQVAKCGAYILDGGIDAWKSAGLPVTKNQNQPIEMMRQMQIAAGSLVLLGVVLGFAFNPAFYALSGAIGAGLLFSGISGTCAMMHVLKLMPWNKALRV
jgi:rhodanese-related sulfurtransferase